jgi:hypothetical protein
MHVEASITAALAIGDCAKGTYGNRHNPLVLPPDVRNEVVTISAWQAEVAKDDIHVVETQESNATRNGFDREDVVSPGSEQGREGLPRVIVVLDE